MKGILYSTPFLSPHRSTSPSNLEAARSRSAWEKGKSSLPQFKILPSHDSSGLSHLQAVKALGRIVRQRAAYSLMKF